MANAVEVAERELMKEYTLPTGIVNLTRDMTRQVFYHNPENIPLFLAEYLENRLQIEELRAKGLFPYDANKLAIPRGEGCVNILGESMGQDGTWLNNVLAGLYGKQCEDAAGQHSILDLVAGNSGIGGQEPPPDGPNLEAQGILENLDLLAKAAASAKTEAKLNDGTGEYFMPEGFELLGVDLSNVEIKEVPSVLGGSRRGGSNASHQSVQSLSQYTERPSQIINGVFVQLENLEISGLDGSDHQDPNDPNYQPLYTQWTSGTANPTLQSTGEAEGLVSTEGQGVGAEDQRSLADSQGSGKDGSLAESQGLGAEDQRSLAESQGSGGSQGSGAGGQDLGAEDQRSLAESQGSGGDDQRSLAESQGSGGSQGSDGSQGPGAGGSGLWVEGQGTGAESLVSIIGIGQDLGVRAISSIFGTGQGQDSANAQQGSATAGQTGARNQAGEPSETASLAVMDDWPATLQPFLSRRNDGSGGYGTGNILIILGVSALVGATAGYFIARQLGYFGDGISISISVENYDFGGLAGPPPGSQGLAKCAVSPNPTQ